MTANQDICEKSQPRAGGQLTAEWIIAKRVNRDGRWWVTAKKILAKRVNRETEKGRLQIKILRKESPRAGEKLTAE